MGPHAITCRRAGAGGLSECGAHRGGGLCHVCCVSASLMRAVVP